MRYFGWFPPSVSKVHTTGRTPRIALKTLLWRVWNYPIDFKCCFSHFQVQVPSHHHPGNVLFTTKNPVHFSITIVVQLIWLLKRVKINFDGQAKNSRGKITHPQKYRKILVNFTVYENPQKYLIFTNFWIYAPKLLCFEVTFRAWKFKYQRCSSLRSPYCKMRLLDDF